MNYTALCSSFNLTSNATTSLEEDVYMTRHCLSNVVLLFKFCMVISALTIFSIIHIGLTVHKIRNSAKFTSQIAFLVVCAEISSALFLAIAYTMLLTNFNTWFVMIPFCFGWQSVMLWIDLIVYAV